MSPYPFTSPFASLQTRRLIRQMHAGIYGAAAVTLALALLTDGDPADERYFTFGAIAFTAAVAALMLLWREASDVVLLAAFPVAGLTVTAVALLDPPLALTPMFYALPLLMAGSFLRRREALLTYLVVVGSFGAILPAVETDAPRTILWLTVAIVGGGVLLCAVALKERVETLLGQLETLAREDPLTGTFNRRAFVEHLDAETAARATRCSSVVVFDIDDFKAINDRGGHAAGDEALRILTSTVTDRLRRGDALGRLGGDEFAVTLAGADTDDALAYAEDVRTRVATASSAAGLPFTISLGITTFDGSGHDAEALLALADRALYAAKDGGRNTIRTAR
ncbi:GGDEF domain-containing protein [Conexibacter sp. JD483]|uniref:GGDEF domain-containing protein n=1 Tax=unclassified Conexibacter TaxID=2627773 RepID=UPI0027188BC2|nr:MULTISPECIES: GGDEF domain-containing protein [unclassified Conexibacter]MDO8188152.1 GGDEF domain-containing protein [Conexibacter sp. CPCC 205706]MDO8201284.1 GGDEF domain-containing protein [Conexibacter sp. CPCC 205762]MDR9370444.1 GGDEF domain-containing protein [Conexibacter sp. JD483]